MTKPNRVKVERIEIRAATPGMTLAHAVTVFGADGKQDLPKGFVLQDKHIQMMKKWGVKELQVQVVEEEDPGEELYGSSIRILAKSAYREAALAYREFERELATGSVTGLGRMSSAVTDLLEVIVFESTLLWLVSKLSREGEEGPRHCVDVCVTSMELGRLMGMEGDLLKALGMAGLLHDVGFRGGSGAALGEKALWGDGAAGAVRHPAESGRIVRGLPGVREKEFVGSVVEQHHEYRDGSGFPKGLKGDEILEAAAILGIAEAFHTLTGVSGGVEEARPHEAMGKILDPSRHRFEGRVMRAFIGGMGVYPVGTQVRMNNKTMGLVMSANRDKPLRPRVMIVYDESKTAVRPFVVDLSDVRYAGWYVEGTLGHEDMKVRMEEVVFL